MTLDLPPELWLGQLDEIEEFLRSDILLVPHKTQTI